MTNDRLEGMNGLFRTARSGARGYRNGADFITMIYQIGSLWSVCGIRSNPHEVTKNPSFSLLQTCTGRRTAGSKPGFHIGSRY
ncbi:hypothetical protein DYI26_20515 [Halomonas litopenaei]|nr:hypothetical protein [Halomonas litopenaei]